MIRVAVIVVCFEDMGEHSMLSNSIKNTWGKTKHKQVEVHYLWANGRKKKEPNDFIVDIPDGYGAMLPCIIEFFKSNYHTPYDYVFKVNTGSYVDLKNLVSFLSDKPTEKFYCGAYGRWYHIHFVSGSGILMSWDLAKMMVDCIDDVNFDHIDDVSIGQFMQEHGIEIDKSGIRLTYHGDGAILQVGEEIIPESDFPFDKVYHYRLRSCDGMRKKDSDRMYELHKKLNK